MNNRVLLMLGSLDIQNHYNLLAEKYYFTIGPPEGCKDPPSSNIVALFYCFFCY
jgi:hypothetical protein